MTAEVRANIMYDAGWNEKTKRFSKKLAKQRFEEAVGKYLVEKLYKEKWSSNYQELIKLR